MYIHGEFLSRHGETIAVHILTDQSAATEKVIGEEASGLLFPAEDPVTISSAVNDTFDHLLRSAATVKLYSRDYIPEFFATNCRNVVVNIFKAGECVFAGFISPMTYSQAYNELYDEIELNCIDCLSALQYSNYRNIGSEGVTYAAMLAEASNRSFYDIVSEILSGVAADIVLAGSESAQVLYDGTKGVLSTSTATVFKDIAVSDNLFLDDDEDSVWTQQEVLEEVLRYLNLHIVQVGFKFYIFDWATIKAATDTTWYNLDGTAQVAPTATAYEITTDRVADCDTQISIDEVFNQIALTCEMDDVETVVESPLDDDSIEPLFKTYFKWMREYYADGDGKTAYNSVCNMVNGKESEVTYEGAKIVDWYVRVKNNAKWTFPYNGSGSKDVYTQYYGGSYSGHQELPLLQAGANLWACLLATGKVTYEMKKKDNSPINSVDMTDYLLINVNGNGSEDFDAATPTDDQLRAAYPVAEYQSSESATLTPPDSATTNYIVISGKITLNPREPASDTVSNFKTNGWSESKKSIAVYYGANGDGKRYYARAFHKAASDDGSSTMDLTIVDANCFKPYTKNAEKKYQFNYSKANDSTDSISKVSVLSCMLIVGDMCVVETAYDGEPSDFTWQKYKPLAECADEDEYYAQSFTIGFNPAIEDYIVGQEYDIQNNIDYKMNIDAEGTAIPIPYGTNVSGKIEFKILGAVNACWDNILYRHRTWFRKKKWTTTCVPILSQVQNILVQDFEMKVYSDNGKINAENTDNDVVYISDTDETFINKKDDIDFKICSQLTSAECTEMGVSTGIKKCTPVVVSTKNGLQQIYDTHNACLAKAEQFYVDAYWQEYHAPKVIMVQNFEDISGIVSIFNHYKHPAIGKEFYVQGIDRNLIEGTAKVTMKEL